ncbi:uncharacterized protein [Tenebrio molitor]|uniref:uncharacterized protein n=1 Tax=Tenebrio molitor TaxID=7067 RepID=UPI0036249014
MASSTSAQFPTKEQAIVFNAIEGLKLDDYVVAIDTRDPDLKRKKSSDSTESLTSTFELLSPAKSLFDNSEQQYPLSFDQLVEFADKVPGESNILELIHKYTSDIEGVSTMLYEIFPSLEHKSIKNRCRINLIQVKVGGVLSASEKVISGVPQGSVLGPLLFIVYTADVKYSVRSSWVMYADNMKIYNDSLNYQMLSNDISNISKWASDWQLPLNIGKCTVLHVGDKNPSHGYYLGGVELLKSSSCLDLGVLVTSNLSWWEHTSYVVKRANKIVYLLSKTFTKTTLAVTAKLIKSYVRPVLEFGHGVWAPNLKRDIDLLESVQRRATPVPFGRNRPEYSERISLMNLPLLSDRRKRGDVILVHQALTGDKNSSINHLFPLNDGGRTRGHDLKLAKDNFRTSARQNFLTNRVFDVWNSLPVEVVTSKTPLGFKSRYDSYVTSVIN